jgi:predicted HD superfamily hydrolase involved in NAD metabolism
VLLHGAVASDIARKKFGIRDIGICSAVFKHTLADVEMSAMDKLLFVADLVSKDRRFPEVDRLRAVADKNLDQAFAEGLRFKMGYVVKTMAPIFPGSADVWNRFAVEEP